jgi:hypothetical protein
MRKCHSPLPAFSLGEQRVVLAKMLSCFLHIESIQIEVKNQEFPRFSRNHIHFMFVENRGEQQVEEAKEEGYLRSPVFKPPGSD